MTDDELMADYAAAIPKWCGARTLQDHVDMMLRWGLVGTVERGEARKQEHCMGCDLYVAAEPQSPTQEGEK